MSLLGALILAAQLSAPALAAGPGEALGILPSSRWGYFDARAEYVLDPSFSGRARSWRISAPASPPAVEGRSLAPAQEERKPAPALGAAFVKPAAQAREPEKPRADFWRGFSEGLAGVRVKGLYGFIDKTGDAAIEPQYEEAGAFGGGLASVRVGGKWGFIDKADHMAVAPEYESVWGFTDGLCPAKEGGAWGFIDQSGGWTVAPRFEAAYGLTEGLAAVEEDGKWGYIDKSGGLAAVAVKGTQAFVDPLGHYIWIPTP